MFSEKEFIKIISEHKPIIHKVCNLYCKNAEDREDLLQEIVLNAWKGMRNFRGDAKFSTWLYQVSLNTAITAMKKDKKENALKAAIRISETSNATSPEQEQYAAMLKAIEDLPEVDKALVMLYLDNLPYEEIAVIMGITVNNVAVKMNRVRTRLKERSKKYL